MDALLFPSAGTNGPDRVDIEFNFTANGASNPTAINGEANYVTSIVYAATGKYTITFAPFVTVPKIVVGFADIEDISSPDGAYASIGNYGNVGTSTALTCVIATFNAGGTLTQFTGRVVNVSITLQNNTETVGYP